MVTDTSSAPTSFSPAPSTVTLRLQLTSVVVSYTLLISLLGFLTALFIFSTSQSRRQPVFALSVVALAIAFIEGAFLFIASILFPLNPWPPSVRYVLSVLTSLFETFCQLNVAMVIFAVFQSAVFANVTPFVYLFRNVGLRRIFFPILTMIGRLINLVIIVVTLQELLRAQKMAAFWTTTLWMKIESFFQVLDNIYILITSLWIIEDWEYRTGFTCDICPCELTFRVCMCNLPRIARYSFVVTTLFSIAQAIIVCNNMSIARDIIFVNSILSLFSMVPAMLWMGEAHRRKEVVGTVGTFAITYPGMSRFYGATGLSECLLMSDSTVQHTRMDSSTLDSTSNTDVSPLPICDGLQSFPLVILGSTAALRKSIEAHLPSAEYAKYLIQTHCDKAGWLFHTVSKAQIMDEIFPLFYPREHPKVMDGNEGAHELALLFLVFAMGALLNLKQNLKNTEAECYHQMARAAFCLQSMLEKPSLETIQVLHMLSIYNVMSGNEISAKETSMETSWTLLNLAASLSLTLGLHRDDTQWDLDDERVQRRRTVFWDLFIAISWNSLNTGRPPSFSLGFVDCKFPKVGSVGSGLGNDLHSEFELWGYHFAYECVAEVAVRTSTPDIPSHATIVELDRKLRDFPIPDHVAEFVTLVTSSATLPSEPLPIAESMSRFVMGHSREVILLYLHFPFFAQALVENPANPQKSRYALSFNAARRASLIILRMIRAQYLTYPEVCERFWATWSFGFTAAFIFGTIATRGPRSLVLDAIKELDDACALFKDVAAGGNHRAAKALPILTRLSEKAHSAPAVGQPSVEDVEDDGLEVLAGQRPFMFMGHLPKSGCTDPKILACAPLIAFYGTENVED